MTPRQRRWIFLVAGGATLIVIIGALFLGLAIHRARVWLARETFNRRIVAAERKALERHHAHG